MTCRPCTGCGKCKKIIEEIRSTCLVCKHPIDQGVHICPNCGFSTPVPPGFKDWDEAEAAGYEGI